MRLQTIQVTILCIMLGGCAAWTAPTPLNRPYFVLESGESKNFQSLAKKQESLASKCGETNSCDHVYFTRALLGLYESREVAEKYFGKVLAVAPKSHLAASSKAWIQLLQESAAPGTKSWPEAVLVAPALADTNTSLAQTADRLVRDLLDREVVIQQLRSMKDGDSQAVEALQGNSQNGTTKSSRCCRGKTKEGVWPTRLQSKISKSSLQRETGKSRSYPPNLKP